MAFRNKQEEINAARILTFYNIPLIKSEEKTDLEKGGEGSKGGKIIGHTKSGKPIYEVKHDSYKNFSKEDHKDAIVEHKIHGNEFGEDYHRDKYNQMTKSEGVELLSKAFDNLFIKENKTEEEIKQENI